MRFIKSFFRWVFKSELNELRAEIKRTKELTSLYMQYEAELKRIMSLLDVSVDVHEHYSRSWAVVSLQGQKTDFIKFFNLGDVDIKEISAFLRNFERVRNIKIDASPSASKFFRLNKRH